ncbi:hypothetical protein L1987_42253 [Smallanthus sonchifolius]|uniref:Uncharacterized protein n=1 Tax=Smallanthus sonchifolius TaxID=185202 RepID=A0ACB9GX12_9ASTR|nr:hypothetical protein L1987_42253 [Smallanthus sonchifolius]
MHNAIISQLQFISQEINNIQEIYSECGGATDAIGEGLIWKSWGNVYQYCDNDGADMLLARISSSCYCAVHAPQPLQINGYWFFIWLRCTIVLRRLLFSVLEADLSHVPLYLYAVLDKSAGKKNTTLKILL